MRSRFNTTIGACIAVCLAIRSFGDSPNDGIEFFEKRIRPLLIDNCFECHSQGKKIKGGLAMDSRDSLRRGGDSGEVVVAGEPEKSLLIEAVRYRNRDLQMPPDGPLSDEQVRDLETWIGMGVPDPRVTPPTNKHEPKIDIETARRFWSFSPLTDPTIPSTDNPEWIQTSIDAFILEGLNEVGLTPAPPADKRTLIRRATFDLIGLPPTPDEIQAFLDDDSFEAFHTVIERLLASPHYGERWGRHWLDVARYADSNGMDENVAYGHAWRYRDYVVQSLNEDKPFDQFLVEQIAGDLLPSDDLKQREQYLAATGFLALGARVLAEPDIRKLEMDIVDEQLDTLGKAFLGMTFGCARCHDHKFDPITQADYYAAAAILRSTRSLSDFKKGAIKFWYEHSLATKEELEAKTKHEALVKDRTSQLAKLGKEARNKLKAELHSQAADYLAAAVELTDDSDFASVQRIAMKSRLRPRYLLTCRQYLDRNPEHPFFAFWQTSLASRNVEAVREHYASLFSQAESSLAAAQVENPKADRPLEPEPAAALDALNDAAGFLAIPEKDADAFDAAMLKIAEQMKAELDDLEEQTPDPPAVMGVCDGAVVGSLPIHIRGSYLTLGENVERDFPAVMKPISTKSVFPSRESGRLQLARWMASSDHPLTARVFVNRMWRWHFGRGLVASTDNFGLLGDRPSHPELLDWLARKFIEQGWSIKEMHRLIMRSNTYQMASDHPSIGTQVDSPNPLEVDPENRKLWQARIQRLEAEQLHDAMLAVSDSLCVDLGGKTIPRRDREFVFNHTSRDHTTYDSPRRALYQPIIRNHLYDVLEQFDYPDPTMPTGSRNSTVVAPQALILLNSPFAVQAAERLADRLERDGPDDQTRIESAYRRLYGRSAREHEVERAVAFLNNHSVRAEAWLLLCQAWMAANEFLYLR